MLSVCIPAYTYVDYTGDAVRSILASNIELELVVVEDFDLLPEGHPERQRIAEVRELLSSDPRIKWVKSNTRRPIQENWNDTVSIASGTHIKLMGADDRVNPTGLRKMHSFLQAHPDAHFIGHLADVIDQNGRVIRHMQPYVSTREVLTVPPQLALSLKIQHTARFREPVCNVFSKEIWQSVGGYSDRFRFCFDVHFNMRIMSKVKSHLISEAWCELRRHKESDGAKLPADLALNELDGLLHFALDNITPKPTPSDMNNAKAQIAYRAIELALARSGRNPIKALRYMHEQRARLMVNPSAMGLALSILLRRLKNGDVQRTLSHDEALSMGLLKNSPDFKT